MANDNDDFAKVRAEIERPMLEFLQSVSKFMQGRVQNALASAGDEGAMRESFAQAVALGALYQTMRDTLVDADPLQAALIDQFVEDVRKRFLAAAAARLSTGLVKS